jgi:NADH dehydrogenase
MEYWSGDWRYSITPLLQHSIFAMKVFVTGGTGFVGGEILEELKQAGHSIRVLVRDPGSRSTQAIASRFGAEARRGNVIDATSLEGALDGCDAVAHLVGIIGEVGKNTFENVHTHGTENVVRAAQHAGVKRFVHMSALGTRANAVSRYHRSKWAAEEALCASGLDYTIFRPSLIYGPGDHFVNVFAKVARLSPVVPIFGSQTSKFQPVSVKAVSTAFVRALTEPRSVGETYDLCGPETFTLPQIIDEILGVCERRRLKLPIPSWLAHCQAALMEFVLPKLLRRASPLNRDALIMLREDNAGSAPPANELFKLEHQPFRKGIAAYLTL